MNTEAGRGRGAGRKGRRAGVGGIAAAEPDVLAHYVRAILEPDHAYARIRELVTSADYLAAKAMKVSPYAVVEDVRAARRLAPSPGAAAELRHLETALAQMARRVVHEPGELYGQLLGRVPRGAAQDVDALLDAAAEWRDGPWLRPLATVPGHTYAGAFGPVKGFVDAVAVSDDSAVLLAGDGAGGLAAWDAAGGELLWEGGAGAAVRALVFRRGSYEALAALRDGTIGRWSLADRRLRLFARHPGRSAEALALDGDTLVYSAGSDVYAYDLSADKQLWRGQRHQDEVRGVAILGAGERCVSVSEDGFLAVWRLRDGRFLGKVDLPADRPLCATAVPGHPALAALGTRNRRVVLVDVDAGSAVILRGHTNQVRAVAGLPDGRVLSGSYDGQMLVWNVDDHSSSRVGMHDQWCLAVAAPRQAGLFVSGSNDAVVRTWDAARVQEGPPARKNAREVRALVVAGGTAYAATGRWIARLDPATGVRRPGLTGHRSIIESLAITARGQLVSGSQDADLRLWDLASGESVVFKGHSSSVGGLALTPDEEEVVSVAGDGSWRRWNLLSGTAGPVVRGTEPFTSVVAVSPDGALVATETLEHTVEVWDRREGRRILKPLYGHTGYVTRLVFTPDGKTLLSASWDHSLRVWDLATGEQRARLDHPAWVTDLVLTEDAGVVVTACSAGGIDLFDLTRLDKIATLGAHGRGTWQLALAADCRTLFSIGSDQAVRAWDLRTRTQLAAFEAETPLAKLAVAGPDLVVIGTSTGAIVPLRLERPSTG